MVRSLTTRSPARSSSQQDDLRFSGLPSGQGADDRTRTRDRGVLADLGTLLTLMSPPPHGDPDPLVFNNPIISLPDKEVLDLVCLEHPVPPSRDREGPGHPTDHCDLFG
ncbi:hypothetical protein PoB_006173200 [Plakobranchus ocellatus]|uniref:Uncharacterized protein n=1 Tax=Plakobranchus ocellatus TaxID=259542 RepID=A0AAV4CTL5_9GAST|nr:hypothetical protein PoB_006173200 [Plakobranchus ocellatus]